MSECAVGRAETAAQQPRRGHTRRVRQRVAKAVRARARRRYGSGGRTGPRRARASCRDQRNRGELASGARRHKARGTRLAAGLEARQQRWEVIHSRVAGRAAARCSSRGPSSSCWQKLAPLAPWSRQGLDSTAAIRSLSDVAPGPVISVGGQQQEISCDCCPAGANGTVCSPPASDDRNHFLVNSFVSALIRSHGESSTLPSPLASPPVFFSALSSGSWVMEAAPSP